MGIRRTEPQHRNLPPNRVLDWERAHLLLLEKERQLEQLAARRARGQVTETQVAALKEEAAQLRQAADEMFNAMFRFYETTELQTL